MVFPRLSLPLTGQRPRARHSPYGKRLCCGGAQVRLRGRRILRRFPISVGAAHWAARGFRALHMFLQSCMDDPCGRPSEPYRFSTNFPGLGRGGPWASHRGACQESTLIRLASGQPPSPFEGEGLSGRVWDPPLWRITKTVSRLRRGRSQTGPPRFAPKALARQTQAQLWNRTGS